MYKETYYKKLKAERKKQGYTQMEVFHLTGIPQRKISDIENGKFEATIEELGLLIDLYEIPAQWVLGTLL